MDNNSPSDLLAQLFAQGKKISYKKKEMLYRMGDVPSGVYLIESGTVKVYTLDSKADENIILTLGPGEMLLMSWAITGGIADICIAAMTPVEVRRIMREDFISACQHDVHSAYRALQIMSRQSRWLGDHIVNLDYRSALERVICRLLYVAHRHGKVQGNSIVLDKTHTGHAYIASSTSLARETVTRELNNLDRKGLIQRSHKDIVIPNVGKLADSVCLTWPLT